MARIMMVSCTHRIAPKARLMPAPWFRRPLVLMTAYSGIYLYAGPWFGTGTSPHRNALQFAVVVVLAWLAASGSRAARVLLLAGSAAGVVITLFGSTSSWSTAASAARVGYLACYAVQICLLMSFPMYQRTRPGWSPGQIPPARLLPVPRLRMVLASAAAGALITLLPFWWGLRPFPCPPGHVPAGSCLAHGTGHPIAYRFNLDILQQNANGFHWLNVPSPQGIQAAAFAADITLWSMTVLLALYLFWMSSHRQPPGPEPWPVVPSNAAA
jgi:hypothetical protein